MDISSLLHLFLILPLEFNSLSVDYYVLASASYCNHYKLNVYFTNSQCRSQK